MVRLPIYLDYNATTPCDPRVADSMWPYFTKNYGNASSHDNSFGWMANDAVEAARDQVAGLIGADSQNILFTSGATESVNIALQGIAKALSSKGNHIITATTEHKAVLETCKYLEKNGYRVTYLDVNDQGEINSLKLLEDSITDETICIALMYANNETGVIHPVKEIGAIARRHHICFFCDATQAAGKIEIDVNHDNIDLMAFSAHKMYGPKGIGALYTRNKNTGLKIPPLMFGGGQEHGLRSGTLNVPGIVGFGTAAMLCRKEMNADGGRLQLLRDRMEEALLSAIPGASVNGCSNRLPHVINILFPGTDNEQLLLALSKDVALSRGSACSSNVQRPSHVLKAMGRSDKEAHHSVRISLGRFVTEEEVIFAVDVIKKTVLRMISSTPSIQAEV